MLEYKFRKLAQVMNEMDNYGLDVLDINETRWTHSDKLYLAEGKKFTMYSGRKNDKHSGVALLMSKRAQKSQLSWKPVNKHLITTRFAQVTVSQCYAPTKMHTNKDKDAFDNNLSCLINKVPKHDMLIVMGKLT